MEILTTILNALSDSWGYTEPLIGYSAAIAGLYYFVVTYYKKNKKYKNKSENGRVYVALQVGRPVSEAVKKFFNTNDLVLVDVEAVLGKTTLETDKDYKKLANAVYRELAKNQDKEIHLVLSGPVGLNFLIGQITGLNHFDVHIYQFDPVSKGYMELPQPDRTWLKH
ncbi:SAVED domain-containing protein [Persephonella sp. KM09-Lau-8]|uniref:SAVED domain-containing protein n=1 Tax=Persephonella sp. KM09-Lau-8 TaxID=1158345 RepID=UPI0004964077|nr:SAVED domain-containing protein [Persephonella sp. KM09-Lau-8]